MSIFKTINNTSCNNPTLESKSKLIYNYKNIFGGAEGYIIGQSDINNLPIGVTKCLDQFVTITLEGEGVRKAKFNAVIESIQFANNDETLGKMWVKEENVKNRQPLEEDSLVNIFEKRANKTSEPIKKLNSENSMRHHNF